MDRWDMDVNDIVSACPVCGAYSGAALATSSPLLGVCDVLVVRALEAVGKRIVRIDRGRFSQMHGRPYHEAHIMWSLDDYWLDKALHGAWDVVPAMLNNHGCCGVTTRQVTDMLDTYVRRLVRMNRGHQLTLLRESFEETLGIRVGEPEPYVS